MAADQLLSDCQLIAPVLQAVIPEGFLSLKPPWGDDLREN